MLKLLRTLRTNTTLNRTHEEGSSVRNYIILLCLWCFSGCVATKSGSIFDATGSKPIVDTKGIDISQYESDLVECNVFANEVSTGKSIIKGATVGAAIGTVLEAVTDDSRGTRNATEVGAVVGGGKSGLRSVQEKEQVVKRCVRGRGYRVLN